MKTLHHFRSRFGVLALGLVVWAAFSSQSSAAILVRYLTTDFSTNQNLAAASNFTDPNVAGGSLTDNIDGPGNLAVFSASSDAFFARGTSSITLSEATAVSGNKYISFTLAPQAGYQLNLTNITFRIGGSTDNGGTSETFSQSLRSSTDSYTANLDTSSFVVANNTVGASFDATRNIDLSGAAFQNLSGPITFRFYLWTSSNAVDDILRFDDIVLNGTTFAVPEPSTWALLTLGALALFVTARRRARA